MTVAKGANLPTERMLDAVEATAHAQTVFDVWAGIKASELEPGAIHVVDEVQIRLAAWQADQFGHVPTSDVHMALGVIEELGEAFDEDAGPVESVDALGDVMVYASQLCTANRLAVRPVIDLACLYVMTNRCHQAPISIAGMLAHVALKHAQNIRDLGPDSVYRPRLVDALALMIAKAIEDCTLGHELNVDPHGVLVAIGNEVMQRKQGDTMIPATDKEQRAEPLRALPVAGLVVRRPSAAMTLPGEPDHRAEALAYAQTKLGEGVDMLATPEAIAEGNVTAPTFTRLVSNEQTEQCSVFDSSRGMWCESDAQLRERINKQQVDLSA